MDMEQLLWVLVYAAIVARNGTAYPHEAAQAAETAAKAFRERRASDRPSMETGTTTHGAAGEQL